MAVFSQEGYGILQMVQVSNAFLFSETFSSPRYHLPEFFLPKFRNKW